MANRIDTTLSVAKTSNNIVLAPFITVGFPDLDTSVAIAKSLLESGADMLEIGVPFSDPLADGPTIQRSSFHALDHGVTVGTCLDVVRCLRSEGTEAPLLLMGYFNPFLRYGSERFVREAEMAGVDGLIVPDLPAEEASDFKRICEGHGLYLIPLLALTSTEERIEQACKHAKGFIYCVSLTGVTGARVELRSGVRELVDKIRRHTDLPVLVGFGISRREHVEAVGRFANGVVVASALLDAIDGLPKEKAVETAIGFVRRLKTPED